MKITIYSSLLVITLFTTQSTLFDLIHLSSQIFTDACRILNNSNKYPKPSLNFRIVVVGSGGMKLSPPSFEFDDGLYVLLKPLKKKTGRVGQTDGSPEDDPRIPLKLKHLIINNEYQATCPWSLSGPQFPLPTAIQQRYCYPKGNPRYSDVKGGALWTTFTEDGKEDLEYRLLHVYFSAKRARKLTNYSEDSPLRKRIKITPNQEDVLMSTPLGRSSPLSSLYDCSPLSFHISPESPSLEISTAIFNCKSFDNKSTDSNEFPKQFHPVHFNDEYNHDKRPTTRNIRLSNAHYSRPYSQYYSPYPSYPNNFQTRGRSPLKSNNQYRDACTNEKWLNTRIPSNKWPMIPPSVTSTSTNYQYAHSFQTPPSQNFLPHPAYPVQEVNSRPFVKVSLQRDNLMHVSFTQLSLIFFSLFINNEIIRRKLIQFRHILILFVKVSRAKLITSMETRR